MIRVLLAHSYPAMRAGLRSALAQEQGIEVVAEASEGEHVLHLLRQMQPDVALIARSLSGPLNGVAVVERVKAAARDVRVLALNAPGDDESAYRMWQAGAVGRISERAELKSITKAVHAAARGERLWTPEEIARLRAWWDEVGSKIDALTRRERDVLVLVAEGLTDRQIAQRLWISGNTVHTHVQRVLGKLELTGRKEAIVFAYRKVKWP